MGKGDRRYRFNLTEAGAAAIAGLIALISGCSGQSGQQLACNGTVTPFITLDRKSETIANQQLSVSIRKQKISFSGNPLLAGEDVPVCPPGNSGWVDGGHYFDSEACADKPRHGPVRVYGTYNELTGKLDLSRDTAGGKYALVQGSFSCKPTAAGH